MIIVRKGNHGLSYGSSPEQLSRRPTRRASAYSPRSHNHRTATPVAVSPSECNGAGHVPCSSPRCRTGAIRSEWPAPWGDTRYGQPSKTWTIGLGCVLRNPQPDRLLGGVRNCRVTTPARTATGAGSAKGTLGSGAASQHSGSRDRADGLSHPARRIPRARPPRMAVLQAHGAFGRRSASTSVHYAGPAQAAV